MLRDSTGPEPVQRFSRFKKYLCDLSLPYDIGTPTKGPPRIRVLGDVEDRVYFFDVSFYEGGSELAAELTQNDDYYFWYREYEMPDYDNIDSLDDALFTDFKKVVLNETKIVKKVGLITYEFSCSYKQNGEWKILSGTSCFKWGRFKLPTGDCWYQGPAKHSVIRGDCGP